MNDLIIHIIKENEKRRDRTDRPTVTVPAPQPAPPSQLPLTKSVDRGVWEVEI